MVPTRITIIIIYFRSVMYVKKCIKRSLYKLAVINKCFKKNMQQNV